MASESRSDHQPLISNENDSPPTYQEVINQAHLYGTFTQPANTAYLEPYSEPIPVQVAGLCPQCQIGVLESEFTCCGVCCAICCFPLGILCCLGCRQRRCSFCAATFS